MRAQSQTSLTQGFITVFEEAQDSGKVPERSYIVGDDGVVQWGRRGAKEEEKVGKQEDEEKRQTEKKRGNRRRMTRRKMATKMGHDKEGDKGVSFKRNRPNLILRWKFYGMTL